VQITDYFWLGINLAAGDQFGQREIGLTTTKQKVWLVASLMRRAIFLLINYYDMMVVALIVAMP